MAREAGAEMVGVSSHKAVLDLDWDDPTERERALGVVLRTLEGLEHWVEEGPRGG